MREEDERVNDQDSNSNPGLDRGGKEGNSRAWISPVMIISGEPLTIYRRLDWSDEAEETFTPGSINVNREMVLFRRSLASLG